MKKLIKQFLSVGVADRLRGLKMILDYHLAIGRKRIGTKNHPGLGASLPAEPPFVTVYVTNSHNRDPLELNPARLVRNGEVPQLRGGLG